MKTIPKFAIGWKIVIVILTITQIISMLVIIFLAVKIHDNETVASRNQPTIDAALSDSMKVECLVKWANLNKPRPGDKKSYCDKLIQTEISDSKVQPKDSQTEKEADAKNQKSVSVPQNQPAPTPNSADQPEKASRESASNADVIINNQASRNEESPHPVPSGLRPYDLSPQ